MIQKPSVDWKKNWRRGTSDELCGADEVTRRQEERRRRQELEELLKKAEAKQLEIGGVKQLPDSRSCFLRLQGDDVALFHDSVEFQAERDQLKKDIDAERKKVQSALWQLCHCEAAEVFNSPFLSIKNTLMVCLVSHDSIVIWYILLYLDMVKHTAGMDVFPGLSLGQFADLKIHIKSPDNFPQDPIPAKVTLPIFQCTTALQLNHQLVLLIASVPTCQSLDLSNQLRNLSNKPDNKKETVTEIQQVTVPGGLSDEQVGRLAMVGDLGGGRTFFHFDFKKDNKEASKNGAIRNGVWTLHIQTVAGQLRELEELRAKAEELEKLKAAAQPTEMSCFYGTTSLMRKRMKHGEIFQFFPNFPDLGPFSRKGAREEPCFLLASRLAPFQAKLKKRDQQIASLQEAGKGAVEFCSPGSCSIWVKGYSVIFYMILGSASLGQWQAERGASEVAEIAQAGGMFRTASTLPILKRVLHSNAYNLALIWEAVVRGFCTCHITKIVSLEIHRFRLFFVGRLLEICWRKLLMFRTMSNVEVREQLRILMELAEKKGLGPEAQEDPGRPGGPAKTGDPKLVFAELQKNMMWPELEANFRNL